MLSCLQPRIMMNRARLWNRTGRAWYMASIAARNSVVELGLLPDHLRHGQPQVTPCAGTLSRGRLPGPDLLTAEHVRMRRGTPACVTRKVSGLLMWCHTHGRVAEKGLP